MKDSLPCTIRVRKSSRDPRFKSIRDIFNRWGLHRSLDGELRSTDLHYLFYVIRLVCIRMHILPYKSYIFIDQYTRVHKDGATVNDD